MDIKHEIRRLVPKGALDLLGFDSLVVEPLGEADLTIVFTDIDNYTALTDRLGDNAARHLVRAHDEIVREALAGAGGREIKHTGDGIMACFASASRALHAAVSIVEAAVEWNRSDGDPAQLRIAIGMNSGAPIVDNGDLFGTVVNVAARIADCAEGDQILVSDVVRQLAAGKGFLFRHIDTRQLDGLAEPVPLFEVVWREDAEELVIAAP